MRIGGQVIAIHGGNRFQHGQIGLQVGGGGGRFTVDPGDGYPGDASRPAQLCLEQQLDIDGKLPLDQRLDDGLKHRFVKGLESALGIDDRVEVRQHALPQIDKELTAIIPAALFDHYRLFLPPGADGYRFTLRPYGGQQKARLSQVGGKIGIGKENDMVFRTAVFSGIPHAVGDGPAFLTIAGGV